MATLLPRSTRPQTKPASLQKAGFPGGTDPARLQGSVVLVHKHPITLPFSNSCLDETGLQEYLAYFTKWLQRLLCGCPSCCMEPRAGFFWVRFRRTLHSCPFIYRTSGERNPSLAVLFGYTQALIRRQPRTLANRDRRPPA